MAKNADGFEPGHKLNSAELQQYMNRKRLEARDAANKSTAKRPGRIKEVASQGEQSEASKEAPSDP